MAGIVEMMMAQRKPKSSSEEIEVEDEVVEDEVSEKEIVAQELFDAFDARDTKAFAEAFTSLVQLSKDEVIEVEDEEFEEDFEE